MQLTRAADYAIRAMIHLAGVPAGKRTSSAELAEAAEVSEAFLSKVLQRLAARGLVHSYRGQGGGFQLGKPSKDISILDIVEGIEGPFSLNCCLTPAEGCHRSRWCGAHLVWADAQRAVREVLVAATLDRLAAQQQSQSPGPSVVNIEQTKWASN